MNLPHDSNSPPADSILEYDYELPRELIAQHPTNRREDARLMLVDRSNEEIAHAHIRDLPDLLRAGDLLVLNDTKVIPAQLTGRRDSSGGRWDGLFLQADDNGIWKLLAKTRGKIQPGETVTLVDREGVGRIRMTMLAKLSGGTWAAKPDSQESPFTLLEQVGRIPLPHYIRDGQMVDSDVKDYQTVFARHPGSVAAPTAGLHFTKKLVENLLNKSISLTRVTLHVGIGTFRPVSVEKLSDHEMHSEWGRVDQVAVDEITKCKQRGGRVIAVGTTSVRVLETAARRETLTQWEVLTDLFIRPGFEFRCIDGLMTNFHLPKSTLLVLVRTFGGDELLRRAYTEAIAEKYRFFSYGDAMLIV